MSRRNPTVGHSPLPWTMEEHETVRGDFYYTILRGAVDMDVERHEIAHDRFSALLMETNRANALVVWTVEARETQATLRPVCGAKLDVLRLVVHDTTEGRSE